MYGEGDRKLSEITTELIRLSEQHIEIFNNFGKNEDANHDEDVVSSLIITTPDMRLSQMLKLKAQILSALKLQEVVKEIIILRTALKKPIYINKAYTFNDVLDHEIRVLQHVIEKSEK